MKLDAWRFGSLILALLACSSSLAWSQEVGPFAFHTGLQITRAYTSDYGADAEEFNKISSVNATGIVVDYSDTRGTVARRKIRAIDRQNAQVYVLGFAPGIPNVLNGSTTLGLSTVVLEELRANGQAAIAIIYDTSLQPMNGVLTVVRRDITTTILVESQTAEIPIMQVTGTFKRGKRSATGDFLFLDNKARPVLINYSIKFDFENAARTVRTVRVSAGRSQREAMEQTLRTLRRLDVYGIHFNFNSAGLRRSAALLIKDIAEMLRANPTWTLSIEGHTDSIGKADYNVTLSEKRAAAVIKALVKRHGIDPQRLQSVGRGATTPKANNDSYQGRAINRRVELVRTDR